MLSGILLVVLAVHVAAAVELTSRAAQLAPVTLLAGPALAVVATVAWILPRLWAPGLPVSGTGALLTLELGALVAAALAGPSRARPGPVQFHRSLPMVSRRLGVV